MRDSQTIPARCLILPTEDIVTEFIQSISVMSRCVDDLATQLFNNASGVGIDDPSEIARYVDRVFSVSVDVVGQTDASILAMATMAMCTKLNFLFQNFGMYDETGRLRFYLKRFVGYDMVMCELDRM